MAAAIIKDQLLAPSFGEAKQHTNAPTKQI